MTAGNTSKSTAEMLSDIIGHVGSMIRNEADLARTEIAENVKKVGASLVAMALALALVMTGFNLLATWLVALVIWAGLDPQWATLAVAAGVLLLALILFKSATSALHKITAVPQRTARSFQRDATAIKESFNDK